MHCSRASRQSYRVRLAATSASFRPSPASTRLFSSDFQYVAGLRRAAATSSAWNLAILPLLLRAMVNTAAERTGRGGGNPEPTADHHMRTEALRPTGRDAPFAPISVLTCQQLRSTPCVSLGPLQNAPQPLILSLSQWFRRDIPVTGRCPSTPSLSLSLTEPLRRSLLCGAHPLASPGCPLRMDAANSM